MTMKDLGRDIREQRERAGLTIDDVATRIKVSARTLHAIENGAVESLPHAVYTKGFVRSFATVIEFNQADLNSRLEEVFPENPLDNPKPDIGPLVRSAPTPGPAKKIFLLLVLVGLLAGLGFGLWYVAATYGPSLWDLVKQPFSAITTPAPQGGGVAVYSAEQTTPALSDLQSAPQPASSQGVAWAGDLSSSENISDAGLPASSAQAAGQGKVGPDMPLGPDGRQFVFVQANQKCWIGSKSDAAKSKGSVTLQPGQVWIFSFKDSLELHLGNAGGVSLQYNGKDMGTLGREWETKTIRF